MLWRNHYRRSNPWPRVRFWQEMNQLHRDMDHLFGGTDGPIRRTFPTVNAWVGDEGAIITAEMPGVDPDNIDITVADEAVTLSGTREGEVLPEAARYHRRERKYGDFSRTLELPFRVDADAVKANFHSGVLEIVLPRLPEEKPKRISVKSA